MDKYCEESILNEKRNRIKLIIDVDKDYYELIKQNVEHGQNYKYFEIIANGIPYKEIATKLQPNCNNLQQGELNDLTKNQAYDKGFITAMKLYARPKGKWIEVQKGIIVTEYKCLFCGRTVKDDTGYDVSADYPFCHCGAKMKGGAE